MICSHHGQYLTQKFISGSPVHGFFTTRRYMAIVDNKYLAHKFKMAAAKPEVFITQHVDEIEKKS
jgi:hypothetical protein